MGKAEYNIFIVLATIILLLFINGIIIFIIQYRKRRIFYDSEKKMINEKHGRELLLTQLEIQEQTMQHIGREIHDNIGQRLTLASIYTNQLAFKNEYPQITQRVETIGSIINESLVELRSLSKSLTNSNTAATDFTELVQNECDRINALNLCRATCDVAGEDVAFTATNKNFILRIIQEFMQNSLKHSACSTISVKIFAGAEGVTIQIHDDGKGFDIPAIQRSSKGIGLQNMQKRAELIHGDLRINSEPGKGTTLHLLIPPSTS